MTEEERTAQKRTKKRCRKIKLRLEGVSQRKKEEDFKATQ